MIKCLHNVGKWGERHGYCDITLGYYWPPFDSVSTSPVAMSNWNCESGGTTVLNKKPCLEHVVIHSLHYECAHAGLPSMDVVYSNTCSSLPRVSANKVFLTHPSWCLAHSQIFRLGMWLLLSGVDLRGWKFRFDEVSHLSTEWGKAPGWSLNSSGNYQVTRDRSVTLPWPQFPKL